MLASATTTAQGSVSIVPAIVVTMTAAWTDAAAAAATRGVMTATATSNGCVAATSTMAAATVTASWLCFNKIVHRGSEDSCSFIWNSLLELHLGLHLGTLLLGFLFSNGLIVGLICGQIDGNLFQVRPFPEHHLSRNVLSLFLEVPFLCFLFS